MDRILESFKEAIINYEVDKIPELTSKALDEGITAERIVFEAATPAMEVVGQRFENGDIFLPEMLLSAETLGRSMEILRPILSESGAVGKGTVVMGTVEGDIHNIGLDIVCMMLEGGGFQVVNLGVDVSAQKFVEAVKQHNPKVLGMSAMLSTTAVKFADVIKALQDAGLRGQLKVMIGGIATSQDMADSITADGYGSSAYAAVRLANSFIR